MVFTLTLSIWHVLHLRVGKRYLKWVKEEREVEDRGAQESR